MQFLTIAAIAAAATLTSAWDGFEQRIDDRLDNPVHALDHRGLDDDHWGHGGSHGDDTTFVAGGSGGVGSHAGGSGNTNTKTDVDYTKMSKQDLIAYVKQLKHDH